MGIKKLFLISFIMLNLIIFLSCNQNVISKEMNSRANMVEVSNDFSYYDTNSHYKYVPDDYSYPLADHETAYIYPDKKEYSISGDEKIDIYLKMNWEYAVGLDTENFTLVKINPGNIEKIIHPSGDGYSYGMAYVGYATDPSLLYTLELSDYKNIEPGMYMLVVYLGTGDLKTFAVTTQFTLIK